MMPFPIDLTFGLSPKTLPWMDCVWLLMFFACEFVAVKEALGNLPCRWERGSSAGKWIRCFMRAQLSLSAVAITCHLGTVFAAVPTAGSVSMMLLSVNKLISCCSYYLGKAIPEEAVIMGEEKLPARPNHRNRGLQQIAADEIKADKSSRSVGSQTTPRPMIRMDLLSEKQWRLLSMLSVAAGFYGLMVINWYTAFNYIAAVGTVTTAIVFLACTTALCRDAVSEQCAEFAVAAAGMVISSATYWPAAGIVGNVVVGAAAVHMALSLTCGLPRPTVNCSVKTE